MMTHGLSACCWALALACCFVPALSNVYMPNMYTQACLAGCTRLLLTSVGKQMCLPFIHDKTVTSAYPATTTKTWLMCVSPINKTFLYLSIYMYIALCPTGKDSDIYPDAIIYFLPYTIRTCILWKILQ